jgi:hypothetical protein
MDHSPAFPNRDHFKAVSVVIDVLYSHYFPRLFARSLTLREIFGWGGARGGLAPFSFLEIRNCRPLWQKTARCLGAAGAARDRSSPIREIPGKVDRIGPWKNLMWQERESLIRDGYTRNVTGGVTNEARVRSWAFYRRVVGCQL